MARSWRLALGLNPSRLKGVEVQRHCDVRICCRAVLLDWLKMDGHI